MAGKRRYGRADEVNPIPGGISTKSLRTWHEERLRWEAAADALGVTWSDFAREALDRYSAEVLSEAA